MAIHVETEAELWARTRALYAHMIKRGLQSGLTKFFGRATRVALIYSADPAPSGDFLVYDTTGLLDEHKDAIRAYFSQPGAVPLMGPITNIRESPDWRPNIDKQLLCFAHQTDRIFFHMWCIERHATESPESVIDQWVSFAQVHFLYRPQEIPVHFFGASERVLEHLSFDVIREVIMKEMFPRTLPGGQADAELVLESLLEIATMKEEGTGCSGTLAIFDRDPKRQPQIDSSFAKPVKIDNYKHIRKLLTATSDEHQLVAVAGEIVGMSRKQSLTQIPLLSRFEVGTASLFLDGKPLCRLANGHFRAMESTWSLRLLKEPHLIANLPDNAKKHLHSLIDRIVTAAREQQFGCTILLDFGNALDRKLSGHWLNNPAVVSSHDQSFRILEDMCKVDGAVLIDANKHAVLAFACLLDGEAVPDEDLSRGARFNSACRYSKRFNDVLVLVVSEDGPVTLFEAGNPNAHIPARVNDYEAKHILPTLSEWLDS